MSENLFSRRSGARPIVQRTVTERDYVVVGSTPEEMLAKHFKPVGKDFPVFLHPKTKAEYALARTERKTAAGYTGFVFHASADVSLEQDLARRDLTINAMAQDEQGNIIDPYHGQEDLNNRLLRHVSPAFVERSRAHFTLSPFCGTVLSFRFYHCPRNDGLNENHGE